MRRSPLRAVPYDALSTSAQIPRNVGLFDRCWHHLVAPSGLDLIRDFAEDCSLGVSDDLGQYCLKRRPLGHPVSTTGPHSLVHRGGVVKTLAQPVPESVPLVEGERDSLGGERRFRCALHEASAQSVQTLQAGPFTAVRMKIRQDWMPLFG